MHFANIVVFIRQMLLLQHVVQYVSGYICQGIILVYNFSNI